MIKISQIQVIFIYLKLWVAVARHDLKRLYQAKII